MAKQIVIDITPAGSVKIETSGFQGKGCAKATEQIEIALGGAGKKTKKQKPEFFAQPAVGVKGKMTF